MLEFVYKALLGIHASTGLISIFSGTGAMLLRKGSPLHLKSGIAFYYALIICSLSGMILAPITEKYVFLAIGGFSLYMVLSGKPSFQQVSKTGKLLFSIAGFFSGVTLFLSLNVVFMVFGGIWIFLSIIDFRDRNKNYSLVDARRNHIGKMVGAWISATTAFAVVNITLPGNLQLITWLLPTVLGTGVIVFWSRKVVQGKFELKQ